MHNKPFYQLIRQIILEARQKIAKSVNFAMVESNWAHLVKSVSF